MRTNQSHNPDAKPLHKAKINSIEFFLAHPEKFDPDLRGLIRLDYLLKDSLRREFEEQVIASPLPDGLPEPELSSTNDSKEKPKAPRRKSRSPARSRTSSNGRRKRRSLNQ